MVNQLSCLTLCSYYDEVKTFELPAAFDQNTELVEVGSDSCIQFVADNVEHQIRTLDGTGTFHGMGIIIAATPGSKVSKPVRGDSYATPETVSAIKKFPIRYFHPSAVDLTLAMTFWKSSELIRHGHYI